MLFICLHQIHSSIIRQNSLEGCIKMRLDMNTGDSIVISDIKDFSIQQTLECGQCFRWHKAGEDTYKGIAYGKPLIIKQIKRDSVRFYTSLEEFNSFWVNYFDLIRDYGQIKGSVQQDNFLKKATDYGWGIRILQQEPWEALISFIISQRNSIPRISKTVELLSKQYGNEKEYNGSKFYTFPTPKEILDRAGYRGLLEAGLGYRANYVFQAASLIESGRYNLNNLKQRSYSEAYAQLLNLYGVGPKVANCVALFGLGFYDAFPVDVWIQRVIDQYYQGNINNISLPKYGAGIIQQYMFYYMRDGRGK